MGKKHKAQLPTMDQLIARATLAASKKARVAKTRHNILYVKRKINSGIDKLVEGTLRPQHVSVSISEEICSQCKGRQKHVDQLYLWSKSEHGDLSSWRQREISSSVVLDMYKDLPLKISEHEKVIVRCANCLLAQGES